MNLIWYHPFWTHKFSYRYKYFLYLYTKKYLWKWEIPKAKKTLIFQFYRLVLSLSFSCLYYFQKLRLEQRFSLHLQNGMILSTLGPKDLVLTGISSLLVHQISFSNPTNVGLCLHSSVYRSRIRCGKIKTKSKKLKTTKIELGLRG